MCEAGFKGVGGEAHTGQALPVCMDLRTEDSENTIPHNESVRQAPRAPLSPSPPLRSLTCPWVLWICPPPPPPRHCPHSAPQPGHTSREAACPLPHTCSHPTCPYVLWSCIGDICFSKLGVRHTWEGSD